MSCKGFKILSLMHRWSSKREMMGDDPPYLAVGTEVSAKYKGAFCEAKVRKIVRSVKCKIAYKLGLGTAIVTDDQIKGTLRAGSVVEVKHPDKKEFVEATIIKIQDCSQYTVVFDDGDITTLRRTALCLKSGRHFAESETLDQLPLTHPEHFGNPVIGGRRGRRNRHDDSSDDDESIKKGKQPKEEKEADIGKVVCVEISEKKKQKDNWFPGLVVAPTAQDTVKINVKEDYLVRSFKDGRYYTVPKKEATLFTREIGQKVDNNTLRTAVEKALLFLDREELPPHWDRELLFGLNEISDSDSDGAFDSDTSDDEPREEKDHFVAQLYKFMDDRGTPINKGPTINGRDVDLYKLFKVVHKLGGYNRVTNHNQWKTVSHKLGFGHNPTSVNLVKHAYKKFLHSFEDFYRKLGCTMVNHPRGHRARHRSNRSLIRDKDKALPPKEKQGEKDGEENKDESISESNKEQDVTPKVESKPKEAVIDNPKPQRESRKDSQKLREKDRRDDTKVQPSASKNVETSITNSKVVKDDKVKNDDREERIKMREIVKHDNSKDDTKSEKDLNTKTMKDIKSDENNRFLKGTRREFKDTKKVDKEGDKSKVSSDREVRPKKIVANSSEIQNAGEDTKDKKSRSLFSKITGSRRIKPIPDNKIPRSNKPMGLNAVRQKRTFSERMKAMVKKLKMKSGVKQLRHKSPPPSEVKDLEEKKKQSSEENRVTVPQLTRSKSKEEVSAKTEKPKGTLERKLSSVSSNQPNHSDKRQGHSKKLKDDDKHPSSDETLDQLPNYKTVTFGDKLRVYYGPTHESKVTYEAKVLNLKEEDHETLYLVHYTGWNTRYDEWIKRSRIADNLSWSPGRAKRTRQQQIQHSQSRGSKRPRSGTGGGSGEASGGGGGRSTTPSSVTSSSSRTKSPAVSGALRTSRSRGRSRRASGHTHTDLSDSEGDDDYESDGSRGPGSKEIESDDKESKDAKELLLDKMRSRSCRQRMESGCESEDPSRDVSQPDTEYKSKKCKVESEEEGHFERTRSRSEKRKSEEVSKINVVSDEAKKEASDGHRSDRLRNKRRVVEEKADIMDEKEVKQEKDETKADDSRFQKVDDKRKVESRQEKTDPEKNDMEISEADSKKKFKRKVEDTSFEEDSKDPPNERRRSKRVTPRKEDTKLPTKSDEEQPKGREFDLDQIRSELKGITPAGKGTVDIITVENDDDNDDKLSIESSSNTEEEEPKRIISETKNMIPEDIYEFKEPEPFEFEVRTKCSEDKSGKIQRRSFGRVCDESNSASSSPAKKKLTKTKLEPSNSPENRRSIKKTISKSDDEAEKPYEPEYFTKESQSKVEKPISTPPEFEKLKEDSDSESEKEVVEEKLVMGKVNDDVLQPLSLFNDLPEEGEGAGVDEDCEDRLVISEPETESESQGPLFSHQQRDHEDFFPTSITQSSSVENSQNKSPFSGFNEGSKDGDESNDEKVKIQKEENEDEDDPIMSAIQRVQRAFSQSPGDEDSNDIDLLSELPDPTHRKEKPFISTEKEDSNSRSSKESNESQNEDNLDERMSQSNDDSDDNINNPIEISNCKVIEEINLESSDSEDSAVSATNNIETIPSDMIRTEILSTILKDKSEESQDVSVDEEEKDCKDEVELEDLEEVEDQVQVGNKNEDDEDEGDENNEEEDEEEEEEEEEKENDDICEVKEEMVENTQNNVVEEVTNLIKEEVSEIVDQVELEGEVILETVDVKKEDGDEENEDRNKEEEEIEENVEEVIEDVTDQESKPVDVKEDIVEVEEPESNLESLLCEETIPGSPAPSSAVLTETPAPTSPELPFASAAGPHPVICKPPPTPPILPPPPPPPSVANPPPAQAAAVMDNTPPTTPESSLSPISNSPRGERSGSSPVPENDSSKSNRDSSEVDLDGFATNAKVGLFSGEEAHSGVVSSNSSIKKASACEEVESQGVKKRRRSVKRAEENAKRPKLSHRSPRHNNASESDDDTSENSLDLVSLHSRSPRPSKYNFFVQLDPELDASQRIAVLQQKLADLRKTYMSVKAELACIDRRRKKLRRREREASVKTSVKPEVSCS